jgi:hypothetical protein
MNELKKLLERLREKLLPNIPKLVPIPIEVKGKGRQRSGK